MAVPGFFFKIEHGLFRVIGLKLAGEPQGVFDLISFSLLPFIIPPYYCFCHMEVTVLSYNIYNKTKLNTLFVSEILEHF